MKSTQMQNKASGKTIRRKRNKQVQKARVEKATYHLSPCSRDYLQVLCNPFLAIKDLPCVPDLYDSPSKKVRTRVRGTVVIGTNNFGFITYCPFAGAGSDESSICYSSSGTTFVGTTITFDGAATGTSLGSNSQAPYQSTAFGALNANVQYRVVGSGLRVRYTGTELNRGGTIIPFRHPQNEDVTGLNIGLAMGFQETQAIQVDRKWHMIAWVPTSAGNYQYQTQPTSNSNPFNRITILLSGTPTNTFEWEIVSYFEYTGQTDNVTPSHSDIEGMSRVKDFFDGFLSENASPDSYWAEAQKYLQNLSPADLSGWVTTGVKGA
jgi:hypothetical protein